MRVITGVDQWQYLSTNLQPVFNPSRVVLLQASNELWSCREPVTLSSVGSRCAYGDPELQPIIVPVPGGDFPDYPETIDTTDSVDTTDLATSTAESICSTAYTSLTWSSVAAVVFMVDY